MSNIFCREMHKTPSKEHPKSYYHSCLSISKKKIGLQIFITDISYISINMYVDNDAYNTYSMVYKLTYESTIVDSIMNFTK